MKCKSDVFLEYLNDAHPTISSGLLSQSWKMRAKVRTDHWLTNSFLTVVYSIVDPPTPNAADRAVKLRSQQEVSRHFLWNRLDC